MYRGNMIRQSVRDLPSRLMPAVLAFVVLALSACGGKLSAAHLPLRPWQDGGSQKIYAKFMHFDFETMPHEDKFEVKGNAFPIKENIPLWVDSVSDLTLLAYLCDERGVVVSHQAKQYPSQKIPPAGFAFDFMLAQGQRPSGGYYVTFGYSGMFTASTPPKQGGQGSGGISGNYVFFASEKAALTK